MNFATLRREQVFAIRRRRFQAFSKSDLNQILDSLIKQDQLIPRCIQTQSHERRRRNSVCSGLLDSAAAGVSVWSSAAADRGRIARQGPRLVSSSLQSQFHVGTEQLLIKRREVGPHDVGVNSSECRQLLRVSAAQ